MPIPWRTIKIVKLSALTKGLKNGKKKKYYRVSLPPEVEELLNWRKGDPIKVIFCVIKNQEDGKYYWYPYWVILENIGLKERLGKA